MNEYIHVHIKLRIRFFFSYLLFICYYYYWLYNWCNIIDYIKWLYLWILNELHLMALDFRGNSNGTVCLIYFFICCYLAILDRAEDPASRRKTFTRASAISTCSSAPSNPSTRYSITSSIIIFKIINPQIWYPPCHILSGCFGSADSGAASRSSDPGTRSGCGIESGRNGTAAPAGTRLCRPGTQQASRHRRYQKITADHPARHRRVHPAGTKRKKKKTILRVDYYSLDVEWLVMNGK